MILLLMMVLQLVMPVNFAYGNSVPSEETVLPKDKDTDEEEAVSPEDTDLPEDKDTDEKETISPEDTDLEKIIDEEGADILDDELPEDTKDTPEDTSDLPKDKLSNVLTPARIQVAEIGTLKDLGNIFTFESMTVNDEEVSDGDIIEVKEGTTAKIRFNWDTKGRNAKAGDTAEIQLSDAFKKVTTPNEPLNVEGTNVGTYRVDNGVLKFEFNEGIETSDVEKGWVEFGLEFNLEKFKENIEQEIPFHAGNDYNITVIARPNLDHKGITKEGHPDRKENATEITWTIDVINNSDEQITDAKLQDQLPEGLGDATNFVIKHLTVGYDGDIREGEAADITANGFPVGLGDIAPYEGYRIKFTTTIKDYDQESFTNKVWFEYGDVSIPAEGTVYGLTRSNPIQKEGKHVHDKENGIDYIDWEIIVNENGQAINNAIVKDDELPAGVTLVPETIKISKNDDVTDEFKADNFPITLGKVAKNEKYVIKFRTQVDWSKVNTGDYEQKNGFVNKATLYDGDEELNDDDATVNIERDPMLRKEGVSHVDFNNNTLEWTIHVNEAGHPIGNVVLTDLILKGLSISEEDIKIVDENGDTYTPDSINLTPNAEDGTTAVKIDLGNVGTKTLTITYETKITDFTIDKFTNGVGINGVGIGKDGIWDKAEIKPAGNNFDKNFKGIDYNEKTMNWRLYIAPKRDPLAELTIEDTFPNKGLILLPKTLTVRKNKTDSTPLVLGKDYTLEPRTEDGVTGYQKGFVIKFLDPQLPLNAEYYIDYKTSYDLQYEVEGNVLDPHKDTDSQDSDREYINETHYTGKTVNGNTVDQKRKASQKVREESWNSGKKEGQLVHLDEKGNKVNGWVSGSERKVAWDFYFNYQEQNLGKGVVVTDTLAYEGAIDKDSVVLYGRC